MRKMVIEIDRNGKILNIFGDDIPEIITLDNRDEIPEDSPKWDYIDETLSSVPFVLYQSPSTDLPF